MEDTMVKKLLEALEVSMEEGIWRTESVLKDVSDGKISLPQEKIDWYKGYLYAIEKSYKNAIALVKLAEDPEEWKNFFRE